MHAAITRSKNAFVRDDSPVRWLRVTARLDDQTSLAQATAAANVIRQRFVQNHAMPQSPNDARDPVVLLSAARGFAPERQMYIKPLMIVAVVVGIVLLVACASFSNLLYGRSRSRQQEYAVRLALGAGRWQIVHQVLVECALLASTSAALGVIGAAWATMGR